MYTVGVISDYLIVVSSLQIVIGIAVGAATNQRHSDFLSKKDIVAALQHYQYIFFAKLPSARLVRHSGRRHN